jgi:DNA helicase-2/ATP-dependent DNA helicase PcrA
LWTEATGGDKVRIIGVWDAPEEARRVGEEIERLEREGLPLDRIAILVRAQFQTREFEDRFISIGLAYRIVGGFRFYERAEIRDALAYLRPDRPAVRIWPSSASTTPKRGLGDKTLEKLHRFARAQAMPLAAAALAICDSDELPARARHAAGAGARSGAGAICRAAPPGRPRAHGAG